MSDTHRTLYILRHKDGTLGYRQPGPDQKWRTGFADMTALSQAAMKEVQPPWWNVFVDADPVEKGANMAKAAKKAAAPLAKTPAKGARR